MRLFCRSQSLVTSFSLSLPLPLSLFSHLNFCRPIPRLLYRSPPFWPHHKNENFRSAARTANGDRSFKAPTEQVSKDARGSGCVMRRCARSHNVTISHEDVGVVRVKRQTLQKSESPVRSRNVQVRERSRQHSARLPSRTALCLIPCALSRLISHVESTYGVRYCAGSAIKMHPSNGRRVWRIKFYLEFLRIINRDSLCATNVATTHKVQLLADFNKKKKKSDTS